MKDVFVIAMEPEADAVLRHMTDVMRFESCGRVVCQGTLRGETAAVVICGIGKVNAAAGTQYAIDCLSPERIVNLGVAGGIDPTMKVAEVYAISRCFQCDFDLSEVNHTPKGTPDEFTGPFYDLQNPFPGLPTAVVATGDAFTNCDFDRGFVRDEMGAGLRDMELAAIAHVCRRAGVTCCAVKAVSDVHFPEQPPPTDQYASNLRKAVDALARLVGGSESGCAE